METIEPPVTVFGSVATAVENYFPPALSIYLYMRLCL